MTLPEDTLRASQARESQLDALVALEQASFTGDRLSRRQYRRLLHSPSASVLAVCGNDRLVGSAVLLFRAGSRVARLYSLAVDADMRGRGVGRRLLDAAEHEARRRGCVRMRLEVRTDNRSAQLLYERAGYVRSGKRAEYYEDGAGAWLYEKPLEQLPG